MYQKKEEKMSPHLSQLNVAMAHRNYFRRNDLRILKLATNTKRLKITILGANWQLLRSERIAKCSYFILFTQNIKFYWFVLKIKKFLLPVWWYNRGLFSLRNKYFGVFVLNRLKKMIIKFFSGSKDVRSWLLVKGEASTSIYAAWVNGKLF